MKLNFWIYIMASKSGTLYAGMTNNSEKRVFQHKHKEIEGFSATGQETRSTLEWISLVGVLRCAQDDIRVEARPSRG